MRSVEALGNRLAAHLGAAALVAVAAAVILMVSFGSPTIPKEKNAGAALNSIKSAGSWKATSSSLSKPSRRPLQESGSGLFSRRKARHRGAAKRRAPPVRYSYSISGVTYETAQDVTGLEERLCLERLAAGQPASVKYDPSNPSNSILVADDWSGLH